jgi:hypothetical protein
MKRCIVHMGMHKTGSTSIQNSLCGHSDASFVYADLGTPNHSLPIYSLFAVHPERHHLHRAETRDPAAVAGYVERVRADLERAFESAGDRTLIVSGEDIGVLSREELGKLESHFRGYCDELRVVGYVRPPGGFITSAFQQRVKGGSVSGLDLNEEYRDYEARFAKFDEVFGRDQVSLWKFDPTRFPGRCVVQDFCARLGIALPVERIVRLNESLTRQAVALIYTYRIHGQGYGSKSMRGPETQALGEILKAVGGDRFRFAPELLAPVLANKEADISWMEARLGESLREELGEFVTGDIRGEAELLNPGVAVVQKLLALLGDNAPVGVRGETPQELAALVHALREKQYGGPIAPGQSVRQSKPQRARPVREAKPQVARQPGLAPAQVRVVELLDTLVKRSPDVLDGLDRRRAEALVKGVFAHLNGALAALDDGVMQFEKLGQFRVRKLERAVNGRTRSMRHVVFQGRTSEPVQTPRDRGPRN